MFWKKQAPKSPPPLPATSTPAQEPMRLAQGMPGKFVGPENELERALIAFRHRQLDGAQFLETLFNSPIFVLPRKEDLVSEGERIGLAKDPHLFSITYPEYAALAIYTSPTRANPTTEQYPEFRFAVQVHAGEFLIGLAGRGGLVINPYWDISIEWSADQMDRVKGMMRRE